MNDLPLLNSERKEFQNKLREMKEQLQLVETTVLHRINRIVNEADYLTTEQKTELLNQIWR